ncbi:MAG: ABC transporter permease [Dehalococcoidia bacterium]|nr:ABC transporter permease [Dehalococcoidia bacterium]
MAEAEALSSPELLAGFTPRRQRGLWSDAFFRLTRNRLAMAALVMLIALVTLAVLGNNVEAIQRYSPREQNTDVLLAGPSWAHFFGTDNLGRDNWSRVLQGTLISLQVGFGVQAIVLVIGLTVGGLAALGGRMLDNIMMRITDIFYAFPDLLFIILMRAVLQNRDWPILGDPVPQMIFAIAFVAWVTVARLVRGQMLSLKERDFILASRAMGAGNFRIVTQHMLPNTLGPVIVAVVFGIPLAIFAEAVLGFIGFGVPPPTASLGRLVADGYNFIRTNIWMVLFPAGTIAILMLSFTFLGDGLRDALDPRAR